MKRMLYLAISLALAATCNAQGVRGLADVTLIDRDSGVALSPHYYHGEYWVAGRPGARYAIEIHNRLGERVLTVTSVDGVNVLTGETAGFAQSGYVFGPEEHYQITGWRKTDSEVAAFTFADLPNSYAARTGRPANVGVIGVAVFRERLPPVADSPPLLGRNFDRSAAPAAAESAAAPSRAAPPNAAPQALGLPTAKLGTGHGAREYAYVEHTEFLRLQPQPDQLIRVHYDSLDNLLALGIIKRSTWAPPLPNPFPESRNPQYVADPPG